MRGLAGEAEGELAEALAGGLVDRVGEGGGKRRGARFAGTPHGRTAVDDVDFDGR